MPCSILPYQSFGSRLLNLICYLSFMTLKSNEGGDFEITDELIKFESPETDNLRAII